MTTKDAHTHAWIAVPRGQYLGILTSIYLAFTLTGCATTGQVSELQQTSSQVDKPSPQVGLPPKSKETSSYVVKGKRYFVKSDASGFVENGTASWYGKRFHGRRTSSGEQYDMHAMTAAHKNLPLASMIEVTNLENGLSTLVRVNDRGPFHGNRVLDLSYAAASKLEMVAKGSARVAIHVVDPGKPNLDVGLQQMFVSASDKARSSHEVPQDRPSSQEPQLAAKVETDILGTPQDSAKPNTKPKSYDALALYLQVGAFDNRSNAEELRQKLVAKIEEGVLVQTDVSNESTPYKLQIGPVASRDEAQDLSRKLASLGVSNLRVVSR